MNREIPRVWSLYHGILPTLHRSIIYGLCVTCNQSDSLRAILRLNTLGGKWISLLSSNPNGRLAE